MNHILILDDDREWSFDTKTSLEKRGFIVDYEEEVIKALEMIKNNFYDILVIDYQLLNGDPDFEDGIKVIEKIRVFDKYVPIILASGKISDSDDGGEIFQEALDLGVAGYFKKGPGAQKLLEEINNAINFRTDEVYKTFVKRYKMAENKDLEIIIDSEGNSYSLRDIINEIRKGSSVGLKFKEGLSEFSLKVLNKEDIKER